MSKPRLQVEDFPPALHRRLKVNAAGAGVTMKDAAIAAIDNWCKEREAIAAAFAEVPERGAGHGG